MELRCQNSTDRHQAAALPTKTITDEEGAAMARAAVILFKRWESSDCQAKVLLGGLSPRSYARWKAGNIGRLDRD